MCNELACRTITIQQWPSVGCLDSWMHRMLTLKPTPNTHQLRTNTALWTSSWHFSHELYITAHNTPRNPPTVADVPITSTSHCAVHCYIPLSQLFKLPSYTEILDSAAWPTRLRAQTRPTCTVVVTGKKKKMSQGGVKGIVFHLCVS